jgi:hypothetical protein
VPAKEPKLLVPGTVTVDLTNDLASYEMEAASMTLAAEQIEIKDDDGLNAAAALVSHCAGILKSMDGSKINERKAFLFKLHRSVSAMINKSRKPFEDARELLESKIRPFRLSQIKQAKETEQALHEEAVSTRESLMAEAAKLRKQGRIKEAAAKEAEADMIMAPIIPDGAPEIPGFSERQVWSAKVDSLMELIKAIAEGRQPLMVSIRVRGGKGEEEEVSLLEVNMAALNALARRDEKDFNVPGCSASDENLSFSVRQV